MTPDDHPGIAKLLTLAENAERPGGAQRFEAAMAALSDRPRTSAVVGLTGTGGAGKSSLLDELMLRVLRDNPEARVAVLATDPTRKATGGALLGDRIRMNSLADPRLYMRSFASRASGRELANCIGRAIEVCQAVGFDLILVETSGIGQGDGAITEVSDISLYVTTREYGAPSQLEKLAALDFADLVVLNKFDRSGAEDALKEIRKQVQRNRTAFDQPLEAMPVVPTIASQFADAGVDLLWSKLASIIAARTDRSFHASEPIMGSDGLPRRIQPIPPERQGYLAEVAGAVRAYHDATALTSERLRLLQHLETASNHLDEPPELPRSRPCALSWRRRSRHSRTTDASPRTTLPGRTSYRVRGKDIPVETTTPTLSGLDLPRVALPDTSDWGDLHTWIRSENRPGAFPFTAGVFPFKRADELPVRMFAGEEAPSAPIADSISSPRANPSTDSRRRSIPRPSTAGTPWRGSTSSGRCANRVCRSRPWMRWNACSRASTSVTPTPASPRRSTATTGGTLRRSSRSPSGSRWPSSSRTRDANHPMRSVRGSE